jgi:T-complex protein 1 subunit gamma
MGSERGTQALLRQEEQQIEQMCADILKFKPDLVITEKGMSDLCQHIFVKHGVTGLRRLRKVPSLPPCVSVCVSVAADEQRRRTTTGSRGRLERR